MSKASQPKHSFGVFFYLMKPRSGKTTEHPIICRISVDNEKTNVSLKISISPEYWENGMVTGRTKECQKIKNYLSEIKSLIFDHYMTLLRDGKQVTPLVLKQMLLGQPTEAENKTPTLVEVYKEHNEEILKLSEKKTSSSVTPKTAGRYKKSLSVLVEFMQNKYNRNDIDFSELNMHFIEQYKVYLLTEHTVRTKYGVKAETGIQNNMAVKYIQHLKKMVTRAISMGIIRYDPFYGYRATYDKTNPVFLTEDELKSIIKKEFSTQRLQFVKDMFIFSCFSGLAYTDMDNLRGRHIVRDSKGKYWIMKCREKTDGRSNIPILPVALQILEKYNGRIDELQSDKRLFHVLSNQKINEFLKEIAVLCGIDKKLTYHAARHTFATTVTLANGVPLETVSAMLGHSSIKMTEHYARIITSKVGEDMAYAKDKIMETFNTV